jgi:HSP20 family protein
MAQNRSNNQSLAVRPEGSFMPLRQAMDRLFQESFLRPFWFDDFGWPTGQTGTNLWETNDNYIVQLAMPGMKPGSINCSVEQNVLTCSGESALQPPQGANPIWQSVGGNAQYRIQLPAEVESSKAEATYENGVLTITLPKAAHARSHPIKITAK